MLRPINQSWIERGEAAVGAADGGEVYVQVEERRLGTTAMPPTLDAAHCHCMPKYLSATSGFAGTATRPTLALDNGQRKAAAKPRLQPI